MLTKLLQWRSLTPVRHDWLGLRREWRSASAGDLRCIIHWSELGKRFNAYVVKPGRPLPERIGDFKKLKTAKNACENCVRPKRAAKRKVRPK